ncbi:BamA/TamA family outer membrane protein [Gloeocapsopsis crepidinum LEGE 06123]|uniref:BamA/TamA family outer membrane protein n=2 Tax=Gloeocapsopsis crepidinum TaxID=693223 RepID=A0ABR9UNZ9_9CHRO|nr:BamA/TamA family outer membrane protein [Gloeocapsopsis crepidinum]MBE9190020.1 BamA/TamA family outer membrane protein [Gloeocapsopsis crepidinum LEGE 06123]
MRVSCAAICTLAGLTAIELIDTSLATASPQVLVPSSDVQYYQEYQNAVVIPTREPTNPTHLATNSQQLPVEGNDLFVTATDVQIVGTSQELQQIARNAIKTRVGGETSESQLQQDVAAILATNLFRNATVSSNPTASGLNVVFQVEPVIVRSLQLAGAKALPQNVALERIKPQIGNPISPSALSQSVEQINEWYAQNGYTLARVIAIRPNAKGVITLEVAEGVVSDVRFRFSDEDGRFVDDKGKLIQGRTQPDFLRRELSVKPGQVFREETVKQDLQQLYQLGLFQSVRVALEGDATKVDVIYDLTETPARAANLGGGYNDDSGLFATVSYKDFNFSGINDSIGADVQISRRDIQFETNFTSPYRESNPDRFGYQLNAFRRRGISQTFDGEVSLPNDDRPREGQFGTSVTLQRPIDDWQASMGLNYKRTSIRDRAGNISPEDELGNPLTLSGTGIDDLTTISFAATKDFRNNLVNPTEGSVLSLNAEQSIPIGQGAISMSRLWANYSQYVPVDLIGGKDDPEVFAFNVQGGTTIGDLPPYEAFNLGGLNSVRGYGSGEVGSGRSFVLASAEYRFPILDFLGGVVFADFASDLGSGDTVLGEPAVVRDKPGSGFGYGAGVRVNSPIGLIRADFGFNDQGESRLQFGFGHRF